MLQWLKKIAEPKAEPASDAPADMIGKAATVVRKSLESGSTGQVKCSASGMVFKARLAKGPVAELAEGAVVTVTGIDDGVLTVAPQTF